MRLSTPTRRRTPSSAVILLAAVATIIVASPADAVTIDGSLDGEHGVALSTQTTQTSFDDTPPGPSWSEGSELDEAFGFVSGGDLYLFISGNLLPFTSDAPRISNQVLGPVPPGTCSLGAPESVDFSTIPGEQYFLIDFAVPARRESMGFVKRLYAR